MSFTVEYSINLKKDASLAAEKQWVADVYFQPSTAASGPTAPSNTTGPLGSGGSASATYNHGDGTAAGFADPLEALQKAVLFVENDRSLNAPA